MKESVLRFNCEGAELIGILAEPDGPPAEVGVLIIVGGPQYRAGSHRQFTLLARHLAANGYAALRFDYRGMGDSEGEARDFLGVDADIGAAIAALKAARPHVSKIMLWGLCDAASAALLYLGRQDDRRIAGLTLLNPWVRTQSGEARAQVKHYYVRKLLDPAFWRKLLSGRVARGALSEFTSKLASSRTLKVEDDFVGAMASAWQRSRLPLTLILSGQDLVAREFMERVREDRRWQDCLRRPGVIHQSLPDADHTFSALAEQDKAATISLLAIRSLAARPDLS